MDVSQVTSVISQLGFPIFVAILCMWYVKYNSDKHAAEIKDLNNKHKDEIDNMVTAINNNTVALTKLMERLSNG